MQVVLDDYMRRYAAAVAEHGVPRTRAESVELSAAIKGVSPCVIEHNWKPTEYLPEVLQYRRVCARKECAAEERRSERVPCSW